MGVNPLAACAGVARRVGRLLGRLGRARNPELINAEGQGVRFGVASILLVVTWAAYVIVCYGYARGRLGPLQPRHSKYSWLSVCWLLLAQWALTSDGWAPAGDGHISDVLNSPLEFEGILYLFARLMPIAAFGLLLISELLTYLFSLGAPESVFAFARHPVMAVHATSLIYYVLEVAVSPASMQDVFDRPLYPLHYMLWTCSVSSMFVSIYYVVACTLTEMSIAAQVLQQIQRDFGAGLLYVNGTFGAGLLAGLPWGSSKLVNALSFLASLACFYAMLRAVDRLMELAQRSAAEKGLRGIALQFAMTRVAVFATWHIFPLTWVLAACQVITVRQEHVGYICGDVVAKYLLLFVYTCSINNYGTRPVPAEASPRPARFVTGAHVADDAFPGVVERLPPVQGVPLPPTVNEGRGDPCHVACHAASPGLRVRWQPSHAVGPSSGW